MDYPDDVRLRKLGFRAWRRGFREADLILGPFCDRYAGSLSPEDLERFEALLEVPDQDLFAWIVGRTPPAPEHDHDVLQRIQAFRDVVYAGGPYAGG